MKIFRNVFFAFLFLGIGLGIGLSTGKILENFWSKSKPFESSENAKISQNQSMPSSYSSIVSKADSAVVNIFSEKRIDINIFPLGPLEGVQKGQGSGVLISEDGYVLTNNHVVGDADEVKIALDDGTEKKAKLIGTDSKTDLALLKIEGNSYKFLKFGDSDSIKVGDVVLAIGNPFGIGKTVTMGIISALKRENLGLTDYEDFIQTDAAINPGNSGGALIDTSGALIGINTAIFSRSGGYQGIGFAVPSKLAKEIAEELKQKGKIERPSLGILVINPEKITRDNPIVNILLKEGKKEGALIVRIREKSSAEYAGLKEGDLVISLNKEKVSSAEGLVKSLTKFKSKEIIELEVLSVNLETGKLMQKTLKVNLE